MKINKFVKSRKGISPIFATLILIAIAVIAGVVVYMFTSGMLGDMTTGGSTGSEKIAIQAIGYDSTSENVTIYAKSLSGDVQIETILINQGGSVIDSINMMGNTEYTGGYIIKPETQSFDVDVEEYITENGVYSLNLISVKGANFPTTSFTVTTLVKSGYFLHIPIYFFNFRQ